MLVQLCPFANTFPGQNGIYEELFTMVRSSYAAENRTARLCHYTPGPKINVLCCNFLPAEPFQTRVLRKNVSDWHWVGTTAYCLAENKVNLEAYIRECITNALEEACAVPGPAAFFSSLLKDLEM